MNTENFIKRAREVHKDEYIYDKTEFINWREKVTITCREHGDFTILPSHHLNRHQGCSKCKGKHISKAKLLSQEKIIEQFKNVHGDKYDYSKVIYKGTDEDVEIICPKHGVFKQTPYIHIHQKCGCPKCRYDRLSEKYRFSIDELLAKIHEKHGDKYKYPNIENEYVNNRSEITIICPIHGEFKQTVMKHLQGQGCQYCNESKLENEIVMLLVNNNIQFQRQQKFDWLKREKPLSLDFYIPQYNVAIECQGEQHFKPIEIFGGEKEYKDILERDKTKLKECQENGVKLFYYTKCKNVEGADIYSNKTKLLKDIINYGNQ
jgi:very-short-patch-repair endonuclease